MYVSTPSTALKTTMSNAKFDRIAHLKYFFESLYVMYIEGLSIRSTEEISFFINI